MRRNRKFFLVLRETVSSYTVASIADSERHEQLLNGLLIQSAELKFIRDGGVTVSRRFRSWFYRPGEASCVAISCSIITNRKS